MAKRKKPGKSSSKPTPTPPLVHYDAELMQLWVRGVMVKQFDIRARTQIRILKEFQEMNWPPRIDDPLPLVGAGGKNRLREVVYRLNEHQHPRMMIRFHCDGSGEGIRWELVQAGP